ncbi:pectin lyase fold/virulence factor [Hyaloraphidium curvatum]|nr:pectin lyase fold/virulence factor [Hyaloraphidium curvatum]
MAPRRRRALLFLAICAFFAVSRPAERAPALERVRVVTMGSAAVAPGLAAVLSAVRRHSAHRNPRFFVGYDGNATLLRDYLGCAGEAGSGSFSGRPTPPDDVQIADVRRLPDSVEPAVRASSHSYLKAKANFARFSLPAPFRLRGPFVYLDPDAVPVADIGPLQDAVRGSGRAVVASTRARTLASQFRPPTAALYRARYGREFNLSGIAYNAGVFAADAAKWAARDLNAEARALLEWNGGSEPLWKLGTQPLMHLLFHHDTHMVGEGWNVEWMALRPMGSPPSKAADAEPTEAERRSWRILHWNGQPGFKPWVDGAPRRRFWLEAFPEWDAVRARCAEQLRLLGAEAAAAQAAEAAPSPPPAPPPAPSPPAPPSPPTIPALDALLREPLPPGHGWASLPPGTRGGADAPPSRVFLARTRAELLAALAPGGGPRIVRVAGMLDLAADERGRTLGEGHFGDGGFSWNAYAAAYDPAVWGKKPPEGPLEEARRRSAARQRAHVTVQVPSSTTIVGVTADAGFRNGGLLLRGVGDVVLRHLRLEGARDHFPGWDPLDGPDGNWNGEIDNLALKNASRVWIDHCTFSDGTPAPDDPREERFGRPVQHRDGLLDITEGSDLVTVSWCRFSDHDKGVLVGDGDGTVGDAGKLRVTFHHNLWDGIRQRAPRVRYGRVHLLNELHLVKWAAMPAPRYRFSVGIGAGAAVLAEACAWELPPRANASRIVAAYGRAGFVDRSCEVRGRPADLFAVLAEKSGADVTRELGWEPELRPPADKVGDVAARVRAGAGAGGGLGLQT